MSVAILGAGHSGMALAAYLSRQGHRVALWNRSPERLMPIATSGQIQLTMPGLAPVDVPLSAATGNMARVISGADVILVSVPASGHADVAAACAPHLRDGQTVLLVPGRTGGALEFRQVLRESGCRARILLGETNSAPFAARCVGPTQAVIFGAKAELLAAALPASRTSELIAICRPLLPMLVPADSVLQTGLGNIGAILHPSITILNADRIETGQPFDFYTEGVTSEVATVLAAADAERLDIARAYGARACSLTGWIAAAYGHHADNVQAAVAGNPAYVGIKAPTTLDHRYLLEDVPTGLIPLVELGNIAGLSLPTLTRLIDRTRVLLGGEPWPRQRTLDALGLDGLTKHEIRGLIEKDFTRVIRLPSRGCRPQLQPAF